MNGKNISAGEFMARYGGIAPVSGNDEIMVFEGTDTASVRGYLSEMGFSDISGMDSILGGTRGAALTMSRDNTDYAQRIFGNDFKGKVAGILFRGLGIEGFYKKTVGNVLPMEGREHARVYDLGDGNIAVIQHKDPGIERYTGRGAAGLLEAALYHFGAMEEAYA